MPHSDPPGTTPPGDQDRPEPDPGGAPGGSRPSLLALHAALTGEGLADIRAALGRRERLRHLDAQGRKLARARKKSMRKFRKRQPSAVGTLHQQLASVLGPKMPSWLGGLDLSGAYESIREPTPAEQLLGLLRENPELLGPALVEILAPYLPPVIVAVVRVMDNNEGGRGDGN